MRQVLFPPLGGVSRRLFCWTLLSLSMGMALPRDQPTTPVEQAAKLTRQEKEAFLLNAKVIKTKGASKGITGTLRATLTDGRITHDASIQTIDRYNSIEQTPIGPQINFRDSYKFNIAAYRLAVLLGIDGVPPSVERRHAGKTAAFTWWVDDVLMDEGDRLHKKIQAPDIEAWNAQMFVVRVFDQLIDNIDRNMGNLLISKDWNIWMIDHTRAFRPMSEIRAVRNLKKCDRALLQRLREMGDEDLKRELSGLLTNAEMKALCARRKLVIECIEKLGEAGLYDRNPPVATAAK